MQTLADKAALLRRYNHSLLEHDDELADAESVTTEGLEVHGTPEMAIQLESIAMRRRRPVLAIKNGATVLEFNDPGDVPIWKSRLEGAARILAPAIAATGRIDLTGNPDYS